MKSPFDIHTGFGVLGTAATFGLSHVSDIGAGFAGLCTGCYMLARAWHVWRKTKREDGKPAPLCRNFNPPNEKEP